MKILNLYAGIGGNRHLWGDEHEITAVEYDETIAAEYKRRFPNDTVIVCDAHRYLEDNYMNFDFIWSSPPCPTHSKLRLSHKKKIIPDGKLYGEILFLKHHFKGLWVVENVVPYYEPLVKPTVELDRHLFWSNFNIEYKEFPKQNKDVSRDTKEGLAAKHGFEVPKIKDARKVLRNCVTPLVGKHILEQSKKKNQEKIWF